MADRQETRALFAGSFDPITLGHVDLIERASRLFNRLYVVVGVNALKQPLFSLEERLVHLQACLGHLPNVSIQVLEGQLMADLAKELGATCLVRGLRHSGDYVYELPIAQANRETIFLQAQPAYQHISSSLVKEIASYGGDLSSLVPASLLGPLQSKYQGKRSD